MIMWGPEDEPNHAADLLAGESKVNPPQPS